MKKEMVRFARPSSRAFAAQASVAVGLSLTSAACSVSAQPPRVLSASPDASVCRVTSPAKVLARRVFVPAGVEASAQDGGFSVRYAAGPSHCVVVEWPSASERPQPSSCPTTGAWTTTREGSADETPLAWESYDLGEPHNARGCATNDAPYALFGFATEGRRHVVRRAFSGPAARLGGDETAPERAPIGHDRFLPAWVAGNVESHQLRVQPVIGGGDPLGPALDVSPAEASVIGRPSLVVARNGDGLVTYVASMNDEFDVFATPIACALN